jgi:hypothetical protein
MSTGKKTSARRADQTKGKDSKIVTLAAARRTAEAQVQALIAKHAPVHARLIGAARRWLRKRLPTAHELVYEYRTWFVISYSPSERGYEGVLAIRASADGVKLYLNQGKDLPDPTKLLSGTGKQARSLKLEAVSTLGRTEVTRLIDEAIARNRVPFAPKGPGKKGRPPAAVPTLKRK